MRVTDSGKRTWYLRRRFLPWRRLVQPFNIGIEGTYFRYEVPVGAPPPSGPHAVQQLTPRAARRERRRDDRERKLDRLEGWQWLYWFPVLLLILALVGVIGQALELLMFLVFLALCVCASVELMVQSIVATLLAVPRMLGAVRSRVDVYTENGNRLASLTVLYVPGHWRAKRLMVALAELRRAASRPFDPVHDPRAVELLQRYRAELIRHESLWTTPVPANASSSSSDVRQQIG
ncbi:hypothetical protein [Nocardia sp. NPDC052112]|uniref:hypothetical protein n=1 Tax=Nocardia sp. NPDC052112 TaxID=3155646 RepID=UPI0034353BD7